jgi:hypothetical protein
MRLKRMVISLGGKPETLLGLQANNFTEPFWRAEYSRQCTEQQLDKPKVLSREVILPAPDRKKIQRPYRIGDLLLQRRLRGSLCIRKLDSARSAEKTRNSRTE